LPDSPLPARADVVIVGGGYTGLMAATRLASRGRSVVLVEQRELGWGASSRNGGMAHPGFKVSAAGLIRRYGDRGRDLFRASLGAFDLLEETISKYAIDCDYRRSGHLSLAYKPSHVAGLEADGRILNDEFGLRTHLIRREELAAEIGSDLYHGGLLVERSGGLHPAKYVAGLIQLARNAGANLYDGVSAMRIERQPSGFAVTTSRGQIACGDLLVATNGYSDALVSSLRRRIIPIGSYIIATEPLSDDQARSTIPNGRMLFDSKNYLYYWRLSPDRRMLFGGRASLTPTTVPAARDWLYQAMLRVHPQLAGVRVEYAWGGQVGFTFDRLPHVGRIDGVTYALGYCGTGVVMSTYLGRLAADLIVNGELPDAWVRSFPTLPFYRERPWFLPLVGRYYSVLDRI
jgi:glycine/D-amino acid oxidase-like deaminating enzyme